MQKGHELTKDEMSIKRRVDRLLRDMERAGLCLFVNDGTLEVYRGNVPHAEKSGMVDSTKAIMSFFDPKYCPMDGGATL